MTSSAPPLQETLSRAYAALVARRLPSAEALCQQILATDPRHFDALSLLIAAQSAQGRHAEALESCERAARLRPDHADSHYNRGAILRTLGRLDEALEAYDRALNLRPDYPEALTNRGNVLSGLGRHEHALDNFDRALALRPGLAEALQGKANALRGMKRHEGALAVYDQIIVLRPGQAEAYNSRGMILRALKRQDDAVAAYDRAIALKPGYADALSNRGNALHDLRRYAEALGSYEAALAANPHQPFAFSGAAECALKLCDWERREAYAAQMPARVADAGSIILPFVLLGYSGDPALQLACARKLLAARLPVRPAALSDGLVRSADRIRVAYLSADFRQHPIGELAAGLFERHDRALFEVVGISFGPDDQSPGRARIIKAFDAFHDVRGMTDPEIAGLIRGLNVDIAVDMMGYTQEARIGVLAHRPAPVQVGYLGYPSTSAADFIDYLIGDPVVTPFDHAAHFSEEIVQLPGSYLINDRARPSPKAGMTRADVGLPDEGFVFCCFNSTWKISPDVFDIWMDLLRQTPGSVLWLASDGPVSDSALRAEAGRRGIDASRLVFKPRLPLDEHLACHGLADLFLDTLPYNAHATAADALWAGLPVLTCRGESFAGRVGASLLTAAGLPELITGNLAEYRAMALDLAADPARLAGLKARLMAGRETSALFDADRYVRHIEAAFETMVGRALAGEPPASFAV